MNNKITEKQKRFADHYIDSCNATQAYLEVYQCKSKASARASASKLLTNPNIKKYIRDRREVIDSEVLKHQIFNKEQILQQETRIASADIGDIFEENGEIKELHEWSEGIRKAIKDFKFDKIRVGTDDQGNAIYKKYLKKLTFHDRGAALNRLEKCYGMHQGNKPEKREVSGGIDIRTILAKIDGRNRGKLPQEE
jgi:phage terminase small subunit